MASSGDKIVSRAKSQLPVTATITIDSTSGNTMATTASGVAPAWSGSWGTL